MKKEPVSRILKTHSEIPTDADSKNTEFEVGNLAVFLKQALLRNEADLKTVTQWIQAKKRLISNEATVLDNADPNKKALLNEVNQLELLRQQMLTTFISQQSAYQSLISAEQELAKRYDQENEDHTAETHSPAPVPTVTVPKKKSRTSRRK